MSWSDFFFRAFESDEIEKEYYKQRSGQMIGFFALMIGSKVGHICLCIDQVFWLKREEMDKRLVERYPLDAENDFKF